MKVKISDSASADVVEVQEGVDPSEIRELLRMLPGMDVYWKGNGGRITDAQPQLLVEKYGGVSIEIVVDVEV